MYNRFKYNTVVYNLSFTGIIKRIISVTAKFLKGTLLAMFKKEKINITARFKGQSQ